MALTTGQVLQNRYRVVSLLGEGGMGAVYRAWHIGLEKPVALKEMVPQPGLDAATLAQFRAQFRQEAVVLGKLAHPHLVAVTDYFEEQGNDYLVMAFVEGESLATKIVREGALPETQVVAWAEQLIDALAYCHGQGVIHRDIKPQNVIITPEGQAVLVDFGLVKLWDPADPRTKTVMRGAGTPEYAPPEQWGMPGHHTDPRSDLYSLGATLYHALAGQAPPTASERMAYPGHFKTPRELNGRVSAPLDEAITRAMALACDDRWPDATAMAQGPAGMSSPRGFASSVPRLTPTATRRMPGVSAPASGARLARPAKSAWRSIPVWGWGLGGVALVVGLALGIGSLVRGAAPSPTATLQVPVSATAAVVADPATSTPRPTAPATVSPTATATPTPELPSAGDTAVREADGMTMVYVPAGTFAMGSADGENREAPVHEVTLDAYWLDRTEVTNAQFAAFLNAEGNQTEGGVTWLLDDSDYMLIERSGETWRTKSGYEEHPVIEVSWYGAAAYCEWAGGRLPTEAEWEYAAAGPESRTYPWGDDQRQGYANCTESDCADGFEKTAPVGSFPEGASWVGALDMAGNVAEWVNDWHRDDYYSTSPLRNPSGPASGNFRGIRGGAWYFKWNTLRAADREYYDPDLRDDILGFRCVGGAPGN